MIHGLNGNGTTMKNPELVASLIKNGGKVLVVGGETKDLPRNILDHPQILIWNDNDQGITNKVVPANVRVIMYNRWVSHGTAGKLSQAAKDLRAIKFPMLKTREIKELLAEIVQAEPLTCSKEEVEEKVLTEIVKQEFEEEKVTVEVKEDMPKVKQPVRQSPLRDFLLKSMSLNIDYSVKGSIAKEANRLFPTIKEKGISQSIASVNQGMSVILKEIKKNKGIVPSVATKALSPKVTGIALSTKVKEAKNDDFDQLESLINDAIAAMKLVQEHMPKVKRETEKLRSMKNKFLKFLED